DVVNKYDPEQLENDATYLIDYFFEGIKIRDYLMSYTLLGSKIQSELSYVNFRDIFTHVIDINYHEESITITEESYAEIELNVSVESKTKDKEETDVETSNFIF